MNNTQPEQLSNSYDEFRYHSKPFSFTNIALLEGSAYLLGLNPPAIHKAKVLELGCFFWRKSYFASTVSSRSRVCGC